MNTQKNEKCKNDNNLIDVLNKYNEHLDDYIKFYDKYILNNKNNIDRIETLNDYKLSGFININKMLLGNYAINIGFDTIQNFLIKNKIK